MKNSTKILSMALSTLLLSACVGSSSTQKPNMTPTPNGSDNSHTAPGHASEKKEEKNPPKAETPKTEKKRR